MLWSAITNDFIIVDGIEFLGPLNDETDRYWIWTILIGMVKSFCPYHLEQVQLNFIMMCIQCHNVRLK